MKLLKNLVISVLLIGTLTIIILYRKNIVSYLLVNVIYPNNFVAQEANIYDTNQDYLFIQNTDDFTPENKQELLNIFYTIINSGWDSFSFICDLSYENCITDIENLLNNDYPLSHLNNFVHPYNAYSHIEISTNTYGRVDVKIHKLYTEEEIQLINSEVDRIYNTLIIENMTTNDKIKVIHDYIINNTKYLYEEEKDIYGNSLFPLGTNRATGPVVNHYASCNGYTDLMSLFLYKMGIQNYKVASEEHIWNLVNIDGTWKHLDLTWDDPVTSTGEDILTHNFFLITTNELIEKNVDEHDYDSTVFLEAK